MNELVIEIKNGCVTGVFVKHPMELSVRIHDLDVLDEDNEVEPIDPVKDKLIELEF